MAPKPKVFSAWPVQEKFACPWSKAVGQCTGCCFTHGKTYWTTTSGHGEWAGKVWLGQKTQPSELMDIRDWMLH